MINVRELVDYVARAYKCAAVAVRTLTDDVLERIDGEYADVSHLNDNQDDRCISFPCGPNKVFELETATKKDGGDGKWLSLTKVKSRLLLKDSEMSSADFAAFEKLATLPILFALEEERRVHRGASTVVRSTAADPKSLVDCLVSLSAEDLVRALFGPPLVLGDREAPLYSLAAQYSK